MAVVLDKANVVLVDKDGNRATVTSLTDNDLNKLSVGLSDVSDLKTRVKAVEDNGYVSYNSVQTLDEEQCSQAQANMDAPGLSANNTFTGNMTVEANVKADSMTLNTSSDYAKLSASTNDHGIKLLGGSSDTTGASIDLRGSTDTDAPNTFTVSASNGVALAGSKDGSLTWNNENVVRKVNNLPADASGNVLLGTEKSTFNKVVYDTGYFSIGTDATYNFDLTGSDLENVSKENVNIRLVAKVTTASNGFEVGDIAQLTTAADHVGASNDLDVCSYIRGNTFYIYSGSNPSLSIRNGTEFLIKANVQIKAVLTAFIPDDGSILLIAEDQTNTSKLIGLPDGKLTWGDKNLVRSVNGVNADASGNVTLNVAAGNTVSLKSTRNGSEGNWTITGLAVGKPLYVIFSSSRSGSDVYYEIKASSGTLDSSLLLSRIGSISSSASAGDGLTNVFIVIPTSTTVVLYNKHGYKNNILRAYQ